MNKKTRIINSVKRWSDDGTCYRQGVHVTVNEYERLSDILRAERIIPKNDDYYFNLFINNSLEKHENIVFINLTQRDFLNKWLMASLRDVNTYLIID